MSYSSSLIDTAGSLVLDTSVLINLLACKSGKRILMSIPNDILVTDIAAGELQHETSRNNGDLGFLHTLIADGLVKVVNLSDAEYALFYELTCNSPSLDDGEAATVAIAALRNHFPILDERKGRLRVLAYCGDRSPGWSLDIFRHPEVLTTLGLIEATDALYFALRDGHMRIHEDHCDHVISLIGTKRALECNSLPGYKVRRQIWPVRTFIHEDR